MAAPRGLVWGPRSSRFQAALRHMRGGGVGVSARVVICLLVLMVGMLLAAWQSGSAAAQPSCPYAGANSPDDAVLFWCQVQSTYTASWNYREVSTTGAGTDVTQMVVSWQEVWNGSYWTYKSFNGTLSISGSPVSCSANLTLDSSQAPYYGQTPIVGTGGIDGTAFSPEPGMQVFTTPQGSEPVPRTEWIVEDPTQDIVSSDPDSQCGDVSDFMPDEAGASESPYDGQLPFTGSDCAYAEQRYGVVGDDFIFAVPGSYTEPDDCTVSGDLDGPSDTVDATLKQTITFSAGTSVCPVSSTDVSARVFSSDAGSTSQECCAPLGAGVAVVPDGGTFKNKLTLTALIHGGCPPYVYHWQITKQPRGLIVSPKAGPTTVPTLNVTATCPGATPFGPKLRNAKKGSAKWRSLERKLEKALHACVGPVQYSVWANDSHGLKTGFGYATNRWCVVGKGGRDICTAQLNGKLKKAFQDQGDLYRAAALWKTAVDAGLAFLPNPGSPVPGTPGTGAAGQAREYWEAYENGKTLNEDAKSDTEMADRADEAASADPPDGAVSDVALPNAAEAVSLRPCVQLTRPGSADAFGDCEALQPSLAAYGRGQSQANPLLEAILTSQNRYGTAVRAGDADSSALQHAVSGILYAEAGDALAATDTSGLAMARIAQARDLLPALTKNQIRRFARAFARVHHLSPLAKQALPGVTLAQLRREFETLLREHHGGGFNVVATFSRPFDADALLPPAGWITANELQAVVSQLAAQGDISAADGAALGQALSALAEATSATTKQQALSAFGSTAQGIPGPTGAFLLAAESALATGS